MLELTEQNFETEVLKEAKKVVLVDFFADWCGPCRMQTPILEKFAESYGDIVKVCKVNTEKSPDVAMRYGIQMIPTLMIFKNGKVTQKVSGVQNPEALKRLTGV